MNNFLSFFYLFLIFLFLLGISIFLFIQIFLTQNLEKQLNILGVKIQNNQSSLETYFKLGQIYLRKQLYDNAIQTFRQCIFNWNKNDKIGLANLYNTIGFIYFKNDNFQFAQLYYEQSILLAPKYITALNNLAYLYESKNLFKKAVETYKKVLLLDKQNTTANPRFFSLIKKMHLGNFIY